MGDSEPSNSATPHQSLPERTEIEASISAIISQNRRSANEFIVSKHSKDAAKNWDKFYKNHQAKFFKDRHWTSREFFNEMNATSSPSEDDREEETRMVSDFAVWNHDGSDSVLLEVGCGVGNMLYPLLETNSNLKVHCCDFSSRAVDIVRNHPLYNSNRVNAFVFDLTQTDPPLSSFVSSPLQSDQSYASWPNIKIISLIFVLSAIPPQFHSQVLSTLKNLLSPQGGYILFRDYAYGDLSQVRYHTKKDSAWAEPSLLTNDPNHNWYKRGDNTFNYFFQQIQLETLAQQLGLQGNVETLRRTAFNRKSQVNMERRFVQAKWYVAPSSNK
ncbi:related to ABP140 - actin binding protein and AdoMet-dependent tRNA methyltransferase [Melanopsichium pennsylvanicum]|uniref:tRNA N(3)-methylcytidine methyltransferase n=1 Tax=Melanopsichium pennsylvanicum TaxID=63383 RepID=A0AAJ5C774_9BASI|nr:related to ABP140 - actin binding protein and AdoMet-dependent tRNA methyltransferase [Melanopsichium pennsylvanicum]